MSLPPPPSPVALHCYRHPDRETGRSCTRCGKPACGDCLSQASIGSHCVDCVKAAKPDVKTRATFWNARQPTLVTNALIAVNAAVFLWMAAKDSATLGGSITQAHVDLAVNRTIIHETGEWYRLVTSGFIHYGVIHVAMNMFLLYQLGQLLEPALGRVRFGLLYAAGLLGGSLGVVISDGHQILFSGGASGAVFGLMTGAAVGLHRRGVNVFRTGIGTTLILNLVLTFTISHISKGAHVGGALVGALCGYVMLAPSWKPYPKWVSYVTPIALTVACVVASVVVVNS
jgi:membrane associated rhomboid family serine protease